MEILIATIAFLMCVIIYFKGWSDGWNTKEKLSNREKNRDSYL